MPDNLGECNRQVEYWMLLREMVRIVAASFFLALLSKLFFLSTIIKMSLQSYKKTSHLHYKNWGIWEKMEDSAELNLIMFF